jgi:hypothetical protein
MSTAALPLSMYVSQLTEQFVGPRTSAVEFLLWAPAYPRTDAITTATPFETFQLTLDELSVFHQLNVSPPSVGADVIEIFKTKLAQN